MTGRLTTLAFLIFWASAASAVANPRSGPVTAKAEMSARTITSLIFQAKPGAKPDFSGKYLVYLDLSELNFKGANLARSDLYGTDFTGANLKGADLSHTRLDRSVLMRADLSGANLTGATILRPTIYADLSNNTLDAPHFSGANMTDVHVQAELSGSDFRGGGFVEGELLPARGTARRGNARDRLSQHSQILRFLRRANA